MVEILEEVLTKPDVVTCTRCGDRFQLTRAQQETRDSVIQMGLNYPALCDGCCDASDFWHRNGKWPTWAKLVRLEGYH